MATTIPAAAGRLAGTTYRTIRSIDWPAVGHRTAAGAQLCADVARLLAMALALAASLVWAHRDQIHEGLIRVIALAWLLGLRTHRAGIACRRWLEQLSAAGATLSAVLPPALAPVATIAGPAAATIEALRAALERWLALLMPALRWGMR